MTDLSMINIDSGSLARAIADWMVSEYTTWRDDDPDNPTVDPNALPTLYQLSRALAASISNDSAEDPPAASS